MERARLLTIVIGVSLTASTAGPVAAQDNDQLKRYAVHDRSMWGFIDRDGGMKVSYGHARYNELETELRYRTPPRFSGDSVAFFRLYDGCTFGTRYLVDRDGHEIAPAGLTIVAVRSGLHRGLAAVAFHAIDDEDEYGTGLLTKDGTLIELELPQTRYEVHGFASERLLISFQQGGVLKYRFYKHEGETWKTDWTAVGPYFDKAELFEGEFAPVASRPDRLRWGLMDLDGNVVCRTKFDEVVPILDRADPVACWDRDIDRWAYVRDPDMVVIPSSGAHEDGFLRATAFSRDLAFVETSTGWIPIDESGSELAWTYEDWTFADVEKAFAFSSDLALVELKDGGFRFLDRNGESVWRCDAGEYADVSPFEDGLARVLHHDSTIAYLTTDLGEPIVASIVTDEVR